mgnify:CR=1 FL=1|tara:strand:+ start:31975 stop:32418 length:444 start_codon:yes stop_codon:yes gene_type:complete
MAIILPVFHRVDNVLLSNYDFDSGVNPTALAGLTLGSATALLTSGLFHGLSVTLQSNAGDAASDYLIEVFTENESDLDAKGEGGASGTSSVIYSATFSFAGVEKTILDMIPVPVPILEQPFIRVRQTTTETDDHFILIKPYIQAIAN